MTSTTLPPTGSREFDRRRNRVVVTARVRELGWRDDGLLVGIEAFLSVGATRLVLERSGAELSWPALLIGGVSDLPHDARRVGSVDEVVGGASARARLRTRDQTHERDLGSIAISLQAVTDRPGSRDGAELLVAGEVSIANELMLSLDDGIWDLRVVLDAVGRHVDAAVELPLTLLPTDRSQGRGHDDTLVTPYSTQGVTAALFVGEPVPAGVQVLSIDLLTAAATFEGDTLYFGARIAALAATDLTVRLTGGGRSVELTGSADADGHVSVSLDRDRLGTGIWTIELHTAATDWLKVDAILLVPQAGPPALLSGPPTPPSRALPRPLAARQADRARAKARAKAKAKAAARAPKPAPKPKPARKPVPKPAAAPSRSTQHGLGGTISRAGGRAVRALPGPLASRVGPPVRRLARRLNLV